MKGEVATVTLTSSSGLWKTYHLGQPPLRVELGAVGRYRGDERAVEWDGLAVTRSGDAKPGTEGIFQFRVCTLPECRGVTPETMWITCRLPQHLLTVSETVDYLL